MKLNDIIKKIKKSKNIAIFTHTSPDPDAVGSMMGLYYILKQKNKNIDIYLEKETNEVGFLLGDKNFKTEINDTVLYDLFIAVDIGSSKQLGKFEKQFSSYNENIVIDHHGFHTPFGKYEYVEKLASCTEIIYNLARKMHCKINKQIATCIYAGLVGDTGRFLHSNTTANEFKLATKLVKCGIDIQNINEHLFRTTTKENFEALKYITNNSIIENNYAICLIPNDKLPDNADEKVSLGDYVNILLSLEGVKVACLGSEKVKGTYKLSFRAKKVNVCAIAKTFGGGGHKLASGCAIESKSKEDTEKLIIKAINHQMKSEE